MTHFNSFKMVWGVEVKKSGKIKYHPHFSIETLKSKLKGSSGSTIYIITDKQFGMIQNSWNGIEKDLPYPFTQKLVNIDGKLTQVIPLTEKQFKNPIYV